jgi:hypothetical protein
MRSLSHTHIHTQVHNQQIANIFPNEAEAGAFWRLDHWAILCRRRMGRFSRSPLCSQGKPTNQSPHAINNHHLSTQSDLIISITFTCFTIRWMWFWEGTADTTPDGLSRSSTKLWLGSEGMPSRRRLSRCFSVLTMHRYQIRDADSNTCHWRSIRRISDPFTPILR